MAHTLSARDLRTMVELIDQTRCEPTDLGFPIATMKLLDSLVPCDLLSFSEMEPQAGRIHLDQEGTAPARTIDEEAGTGSPFWLHYWDSAPCSYPSRTGDERSITTISDFYSRRQWHSTGMYQNCLRGFEHEAMMCLSAPDNRARRFILLRATGRDFDDRERLILALLRPHLDEAYQDLQRQRVPEVRLTTQQRRVLRLVAEGLSNTEVARDLAIATTTVRTHLENIFDALGVTSRGAAVAKAFPRPPY